MININIGYGKHNDKCHHYLVKVDNKSPNWSKLHAQWFFTQPFFLPPLKKWNSVGCPL